MSKPRVYVTRIIPEAGLHLVQEACQARVWQGETPPPREVLLEEVRGPDGLLALLTDPIDAALMDAAGPQLRVISNYAVGYNNIDVPAATERGILMGNTPGVLTDTTADMAFTLLMAATHRSAGRHAHNGLVATACADGKCHVATGAERPSRPGDRCPAEHLSYP